MVKFSFLSKCGTAPPPAGVKNRLAITFWRGAPRKSARASVGVAAIEPWIIWIPGFYSRTCTPLEVKADTKADFAAQQVVLRDRVGGTAVRLDAVLSTRLHLRRYVQGIVDGGVELPVLVE